MADSDDIKELFRRTSKIEAHLERHEAVCEERYGHIRASLDGILESLQKNERRRDEQIEAHKEDLKKLNNERNQRIGARYVITLILSSSFVASLLAVLLGQLMGM